MRISKHNGCSASRPGDCIISVFVWCSNYFVLKCVRFLDAENVSVFYLRYLHEVGGCVFGMLQVDLHTSYMALFFMFPCVSHCVEFSIRLNFSSLCVACNFLMKLAD